MLNVLRISSGVLPARTQETTCTVNINTLPFVLEDFQSNDCEKRRSDNVDLREINYLGSSLIVFCISTGKRSWLSLRKARFSNQGLRLGPVVEKDKAAFIIHYSKSISDDPRYFIS